MPESPDTDLVKVEEEAKAKITAFDGEVGKTEKQPIAFGLTALLLYFVMDESKGSTDELEKEVTALEGVNSVEITDVRRAVG